MMLSNPPTSATNPTVSIQVANKQYVDTAQRWNPATYMPLMMAVIQATNNIYVPGPYASFFDLAPRIAAAPVNVNDAVNKQYVDSLIGGNSFWSLDTSDTPYITTSYNVQFGSLILLGNLTASGTTSLAYPIFPNSPVNPTDGVNKSYVDNLINQLCTLNPSLVNPLTGSNPVQPQQKKKKIFLIKCFEKISS
jgi:hypothetical protein